MAQSWPWGAKQQLKKKNTRESVVGTFKIYVQQQLTTDTKEMLLQDFVNQFLKKNISGVAFKEVWVDTFKKENLPQKYFLNNVG